MITRERRFIYQLMLIVGLLLIAEGSLSILGAALACAVIEVRFRQFEGTAE